MWKEFREFALKGNMIELAVAVVIGAAFKTVIDSLVADVIMPIVGFLTPAKVPYTEWVLTFHGLFKDKPIYIGKFLGALVNFVIVAFAIFVTIQKLMGTMMKKMAPATPAAPAEPTNKECVRCLSIIPIKATKCPHCTADLAPVGV